jgi:hypothetical protein
VSKGPSMQLYQEGILQGITVEAIPGSERPKNLDGTMVGDIGFDPLGFSNWLNLNWAREAEIKHGRVAMLAATGMIVQDIAVIPGFDKEFSGAAMMKLHNLAVQQVFCLPPLAFWCTAVGMRMRWRVAVCAECLIGKQRNQLSRWALLHLQDVNGCLSQAFECSAPRPSCTYERDGE